MTIYFAPMEGVPRMSVSDGDQKGKGQRRDAGDRARGGPRFTAEPPCAVWHRGVFEEPNG